MSSVKHSARYNAILNAKSSNIKTFINVLDAKVMSFIRSDSAKDANNTK